MAKETIGMPSTKVVIVKIKIVEEEYQDAGWRRKGITPFIPECIVGTNALGTHEGIITRQTLPICAQ